MKAISSKEFNTNQKKYSEMAVNEEVFLKRDNGMYSPMYRPLEMQYPEQEILEPDEDFYRAITMDELLERVLDDIHKFYANK